MLGILLSALRVFLFNPHFRNEVSPAVRRRNLRFKVIGQPAQGLVSENGGGWVLSDSPAPESLPVTPRE